MGNTYNEPGSIGKHIFHANNTHSDLVTNLGKCQIAIETDTLLLGYKDHLGAYHNAGGGGASISILSSAPAAVAGTVVPWMLDTDVANDNMIIRLVFPDGTDKGYALPLQRI